MTGLASGRRQWEAAEQGGVGRVAEEGERVGPFRNCILVAAIAFLTMQGIAWAENGNPDLPKADLKGHWRVITHDEKTTSSKCIGSGASPICAVETFLACKYRDDHNLCEKIGMGAQVVDAFYFNDEYSEKPLKFSVSKINIRDGTHLNVEYILAKGSFGDDDWYEKRTGNPNIDLRKINGLWYVTATYDP